MPKPISKLISHEIIDLYIRSYSLAYIREYLRKYRHYPISKNRLIEHIDNTLYKPHYRQNKSR